MILLFILLCALIATYFSLPYFVANHTTISNSFLNDVATFTESHVEEPPPRVITPFPFDPNTIPKAKLLEMGLSEYQAGMLVKYRNSGGKFYKKEDVARIYSINDEQYNILEPFIVIASKPEKPKIEPGKSSYHPHAFDPNDADSNVLARIGLSQKQIQQIINYREAGGIFEQKSDFKKIYSISDEDYAQLEKYILLPSKDSLNKSPQKIQMPLSESIEINSADTLELQKLNGIGPVYAGRIVDYRNKLGGFYDKSQLLEIFGIDTNRYVSFENQITLDPTLIRKIDINNTNFKELLNHPYLEYYMVKSIFNYKEAVGEFDSISELRQIDLIYEQLYQKIAPYLLVDTHK